MNTYSSYRQAKMNGGWHAWAARSPLPKVSYGHNWSVDDALAAGYKPARQVKNATTFVLVYTSYTKGYIRTSAKSYASVWAK